MTSPRNGIEIVYTSDSANHGRKRPPPPPKKSLPSSPPRRNQHQQNLPPLPKHQIQTQHTESNPSSHNANLSKYNYNYNLHSNKPSDFSGDKTNSKQFHTRGTTAVPTGVLTRSKPTSIASVAPEDVMQEQTLHIKDSELLLSKSFAFQTFCINSDCCCLFFTLILCLVLSFVCTLYGLGQITSLELTNYWCDKKDLDAIYANSLKYGLNEGTNEGCWKSKQFTVDLTALFDSSISYTSVSDITDWNVFKCCIWLLFGLFFLIPLTFIAIILYDLNMIYYKYGRSEAKAAMEAILQSPTDSGVHSPTNSSTQNRRQSEAVQPSNNSKKCCLKGLCNVQLCVSFVTT